VNIIDFGKEKILRQTGDSRVTERDKSELGDYAITGSIFSFAHERGMPMENIIRAFFESPHAASFEVRVQIWLYQNGRKMLGE
jgi:hypothetical protein